jgi:hypothetical protein
MDIIYLLLTLGFFAMTIGLLKVCQQLRKSR